MKKLIYMFPLAIMLLSCQKDRDVDVTYIITKAVSGFDVSYCKSDGKLVSEWVPTASADDRWTFGFSAREGDIVYVSARYYDITSAINVQILVDGRVYKQGSSAQDTVRFVTVSGTVPY